MTLKTNTTTTSVLITLATLLGVTLHENKLDKLISATAGYAALAGTNQIAGMRGDPHTHVERVNVTSAFGNKVPANRLRYIEGKQHVLQQNVPRGRHPFDNYLLPLFS
jgi:hypothetical protein